MLFDPESKISEICSSFLDVSIIFPDLHLLAIHSFPPQFVLLGFHLDPKSNVVRGLS